MYTCVGHQNQNSIQDEVGNQCTALTLSQHDRVSFPSNQRDRGDKSTWPLLRQVDCYTLITQTASGAFVV